MGKANLLIIFLMSLLLVGCASNGQTTDNYSEEKVDEFLAETLEQLQVIVSSNDGVVYRNDLQVFVILKGDNSFSSGSSTIKKQGLSVIKQFADYLANTPQSKIFILGHTDSRGAEEYNQQLSTERALSVYNLFKAQGIDEDRLNSFGVGEWNPIASNKLASGRRENRRIEIRITPIFEYFPE